MKPKAKKITSETLQKRNFYLLPNLFTIGALFAGFYAIVSALSGAFDHASIAIFIAMIMDSLDGRVARLTHTTTPFGAELDSLADMVAFGVAPALVVYSWTLYSLGKVGWLAAFIYAAAVALRLARFNTQESKSKRYFTGLPCPAAAAVIAGLIWASKAQTLLSSFANIIVAVIVIALAVLMVSNLGFRSFKDFDFKNDISFFVILEVVLILVLIAIDPPIVLFTAFTLYAITGPATWVWNKFRKNKIQEVSLD